MKEIKLSEYSLENNMARSSSGLGHQIFILGITDSNSVRATGSQAKIGKYPWNSEAFTNRIRPATSEPNTRTCCKLVARPDLGSGVVRRRSSSLLVRTKIDISSIFFYLPYICYGMF